jgi:hypothetical protein
MDVTAASLDQAFEHEGALWKPLPGCTSTFDDLLCAQRRFSEIFDETLWNPWRESELESESDHARHVMGEWTRAEPGHRPMTKRRVAAMSAAITRKVRAERAADEARWERDKARYDAERERARFALLEQEAIHIRNQRDLAEHRAGTMYPAMPADRRDKAIADLEAKISATEREILRVAAVVGDPEDVVDIDGKLPRDRRKWNLIWYGIRRRQRVEDLQKSIRELREAVAASKDRQEKSTLKSRLSEQDRQLHLLLAVPILSAADMCADCATPNHQHGYGEIHEMWPCRQWPMHAEQMARVWEILRSASTQSKPAETPLPKPQPLATLPGSLPIGEVIERLSALQAEHPDAVVKRGRANRWELWPKD